MTIPSDEWIARAGVTSAHEEDAFITILTYHFRPARRSDECAQCGPLPLGSSFPKHQWDEFVKLRTQ